MSDFEQNSSSWEEPLVDESRRRFMGGVLVCVASMMLEKSSNRGNSGNSEEYNFVDNIPEASEDDEMLDPAVSLRPGLQDLEHGSCAQEECEGAADLSLEQNIRRNAPVFTLTHTVKDGDSLYDLSKRYYAPELVEDGTAIAALLAANPHIADPGIINPEGILFIPVADPAVVRIDGDNPLAQAAETYKFSLESLLALNPTVEDGIIYLPVQSRPSLSEDEQVYVVGSGDNSYYGIARDNDFDLAVLLGKNRPQLDHLERGHVLIARAAGEEVVVTTSAVESPETEPTPTSLAPVTEEQPNQAPEISAISTSTTEFIAQSGIDALIAQRTWSGEIDGSLASAELEQQITIERLNSVELSREGYEDFITNINTEYSGVFEEAETTHPDGLIANPEYFIVHHTAQAYRESQAGVQQFIQSIIGQGLSVQWLIDRTGSTYQLVTDPLIGCQHASPRNGVSTGVEIMTDETRAQGSINELELTSALYLAYYVHTEVYGRDPAAIESVVFGHRDINERMRDGTAGKPDFFTNVMEDAFYPKLRQLAGLLA